MGDRGELAFRRNAARVTIDAVPELPELYRARFGGRPPRRHEADGRVTFEYPRISPPWRARAAAVSVSAEVPWDLRFDGGVRELRVDLAAGELRSLEITGGVRHAELRLPAPRGVVPIRIRGGASGFTILRPASVPVRLHIARGASRLMLDEQRLGSVGGEVRLDTPGAAESADRYEVEVVGGASRLTITRPPVPAPGAATRSA